MFEETDRLTHHLAAAAAAAVPLFRSRNVSGIDEEETGGCESA